MKLKKCPNCNKEISIEAKFCGFCGSQLLKKQPDPEKKTKSSFAGRQVIFAVMFLLYLSLSYFTSIGHVIEAFHERTLALEIVISEFQTNFIGSLTYIFDFIFSMLFVGLVVYWFRSLKTWLYLLTGLLLKYWIPLLIVGILTFTGQFGAGEWPGGLISMIVIQVVAVLSGSFLGVKIARRFNYADRKDKTNFFFYGLSKKFWFLMTIAYNPIFDFLSKLSVFAFYTSSKTISDIASWEEFFSKGYVWGILIAVLIPFVLLAVSLKLFAIGIEAVKNKQARFRKFKIITILILIPVLIVLIPILRNRTWFF